MDVHTRGLVVEFELELGKKAAMAMIESVVVGVEVVVDDVEVEAVVDVVVVVDVIGRQQIY